jgi:hypothetical protein
MLKDIWKSSVVDRIMMLMLFGLLPPTAALGLLLATFGPILGK